MFGIHTYKGNLFALLLLIAVFPTLFETIWLRHAISAQAHLETQTEAKFHSDFFKKQYELLILDGADFGSWKDSSLTSAASLITRLGLDMVGNRDDVTIELYNPNKQLLYATGQTADKEFLMASFDSGTGINNSHADVMFPLLNPKTNEIDYFVKLLTFSSVSSSFESVLSKGSLVIMLTTTSVALLIGYFLISWMAKPMINLSQFLDDPRVPIKQIRGAVEVERLRDRIVENTLKLQSYNAELEQRVEERTQELKASLVKNSQDHTLAYMGRMAISISHEINTPLGINITSLSSIRESVEAMFNKLECSKIKRSDLYDFIDKARLNLDIQENASLKMAACLEQLKRVTTNTFSNHQRLMREVVSDTIAVQQNALKDKNITLHLVNDAPELQVFNQAIYQILLNLIQNCIEHAFPNRDDGNIHLRIGHVNSITTIQFSDDGIGVTESQLKHLFEPFFTSSTLGTRLGLGTYEIYNSVHQQLGGEIEAKNLVSGGLQITIRFGNIK